MGIRRAGPWASTYSVLYVRFRLNKQTNRMKENLFIAYLVSAKPGSVECLSPQCSELCHQQHHYSPCSPYLSSVSKFCSGTNTCEGNREKWGITVNDVGSGFWLSAAMSGCRKGRLPSSATLSWQAASGNFCLIFECHNQSQPRSIVFPEKNA